MKTSHLFHFHRSDPLAEIDNPAFFLLFAGLALIVSVAIVYLYAAMT